MKWIKNNRGVSLIEVLAAILLITIVSLLAFDIVNASKKQSVEQTKEGQQINDAAYVLKVVTKDVRKSSKVEILPDNEYIFHLHETSQKVTYKYVNNELLRNGQLLANHVNGFELKSIEENAYIDVSFTINSQAYKATLAYRKGSL